MRFIRLVFSAMLCLVMAPWASLADTAFPDLTGEAVLTISGLDPDRFERGVVVFDRARLEALGLTSFSTTTVWTKGAHKYTGVSLKTLLDFLGVAHGVLNSTALNDYSVQVPVSDAVEGGPILAYLQDGEEMSVRDKGPVWLIYPFDDTPSYRNEQTYTRAIWQLDRIEVVP